MIGNKYLPSLGFILVSTTMALTIIFIKWALSPLSYEKAMEFEKKGHLYYKAKDYKASSKYFLKSALINDTNTTRAYRYRCTGSSLSAQKRYKEALKYYKEALKYNPENKLARDSVAWLYNTKKVKQTKIIKKVEQEEVVQDKIQYFNRAKGGWSQGKYSGAKIYTNKKSFYTINYFTSNPKKKTFNIILSINHKVIQQKVIKTREKYTYTFPLSKGTNELSIEIDETFNLSKLGLSKDNRDLGINYTLTKQEAKK